MLLLGHRGAADRFHPENTLAAVDRALHLGADGVEVDVRLTADGVLVCSHDASLRRTAGLSRDVSSMTAAEMAGVRASGHPLPTLDEVVDLVSDRGRLVVEMKISPRPDASASATAAAVIRRLARDVPGDVVVSSFDRPRLRQVREARLPVRTALLSRPGVPLAVALRRAVQGGHAEAHVHVLSLLARPHLIAQAHRLGLAVTGWTVDRPMELRWLAAVGVEAAICDDPGAARGHLRGNEELERTG